MTQEELKTLFPKLEEDLRREMLAHAQIREVKAGSTILRVGQVIRSTILVVQGIVKLYREDQEGREFFIYSLTAGQGCSLSMVCASNHESSEVMAKAVTDATLLMIPIEFMEKWMSQYKSWYQFVITSYRNRFEELLNTIDAIAFTKLDQRLENYLIGQSHVLGRNLKMTHKQIANDLNSSREVVSRLLKKMEARKWLIIHRNSIEWIRKQ
jgi:CRP/FNR family transcriptional regulator, anaerobic regulatory protein